MVCVCVLFKMKEPNPLKPDKASLLRGLGIFGDTTKDFDVPSSLERNPAPVGMMVIRVFSSG